MEGAWLFISLCRANSAWNVIYFAVLSVVLYLCIMRAGLKSLEANQEVGGRKQCALL